MAGSDLGTIRATLNSPETTHEARIDGLRELIEVDKGEAAREVLLEVSQLEACAGVREFIVRAFGYLDHPQALTDASAFLADENPAVVVNAVKAMIAQDPEQAVVTCEPIFENAKSSRAHDVAKVLAERCRHAAEGLFMGFMYSSHGSERALSLYYLLQLSPDEAVPLTLDLLRRERKSGVRKLLMKALKSKAESRHHREVERFLQENLKNLATLNQVLDALDARDAPTEEPQETVIDGVSPGAHVQLSRRLDPSGSGD